MYKRGELLKIKKLTETSEKWDNLAQAIFQTDPDLKENSDEWFKKFYVISNNLDDEIKDIKNKIYSPHNRFIFITGEIGSGKSLLLTYLDKKIIPGLPHNSSHNAQYCDRRRISIAVDFDERPKGFENDETRIVAEGFMEKLIVNIKNETNKLINSQEENSFLEAQFKSSKKNKRDIFRKLENIIKDSKPGINKNDEAYAEIKKEVLYEFHQYCNTFKSDNKYNFNHLEALSYCLALLKHVLYTKYNASRGCLLLIIDNIDKLSSFQQRTVLDSIINHIMPSYEGLIIITMRNETFEQHKIRSKFTNVADFKKQETPNLIDVILNRISMFIENPKDYSNKCLTCTTNEFDTKCKAIEKLKDFIINNKRNLNDFLNNIFGKSIRNLIVGSDFLIKLSNEFINEDVSIGKLKRLFLSQGENFYQQETNIFINNLFRVKENKCRGEALLKLYILKYLNLLNDIGKNGVLSKLYSDLGRFEFDLELLPEALNDMMNLERQLIISHGQVEFDKNDLNSDDELEITELGLNHINKLIKDQNYMQEVVLDTYYPIEQNSDLIKQYLSEDTLSSRYNIIIQFLKDLYEEEGKLKSIPRLTGFKIYLDSDKFNNLFNTFFAKEILQGIYEDMKSTLEEQIKKEKREEIKNNLQGTSLNLESIYNTFI